MTFYIKRVKRDLNLSPNFCYYLKLSRLRPTFNTFPLNETDVKDVFIMLCFQTFCHLTKPARQTGAVIYAKQNQSLLVSTFKLKSATSAYWLQDSTLLDTEAFMSIYQRNTKRIMLVEWSDSDRANSCAEVSKRIESQNTDQETERDDPDTASCLVARASLTVDKYNSAQNYIQKPTHSHTHLCIN